MGAQSSFQARNIKTATLAILRYPSVNPRTLTQPASRISQLQHPRISLNYTVVTQHIIFHATELWTKLFAYRPEEYG